MSFRQRTRMGDRATITRREQVDTNDVGEPIYETVTVAEDVPCRFSAESTSFVREDSGERVNRPASVTFGADVDLEEGDTVEIDRSDTEVVESSGIYGDGIYGNDLYSPVSETITQIGFEVRGVNRTQDHRRGVTTGVEADLERAD